MVDELYANRQHLIRTAFERAALLASHATDMLDAPDTAYRRAWSERLEIMAELAVRKLIREAGGRT